MKESAYKKAGVDIVAGDEVVDRIGPHVRATHRSGVMTGLGGFGALFDLKKTGYRDPVLVSSTDGVGTKLKIAIETGIHATVGIDLVAMCVNDIVVQGAEPLFFLDYFATGKLDPAHAEAVIAGIAKGCLEAGCALIGGETAEMPGLYAAGDYDLAGFAVGAVERDRLVSGETITAGDILIGLPSSGVHSNGYSLARHICGDKGYSRAAPFAPGNTLGDALMIPTRIYVKSILKALSVSGADGKPLIKGMAHITGGGLLENIPRILPAGLDAVLDAKNWPFLPVFGWLKEQGRVENEDMARTFNCGIGMVIACAPDDVGKISGLLKDAGERPAVIGSVAASPAGADSVVRIENMDSAWKN